MNTLQAYRAARPKEFNGFIALLLVTIVFSIVLWRLNLEMPLPYSLGVLAQFLMSLVMFSNSQKP